MIRLGVPEILEAHIMTRWTRQAKDVLPENMKGHQNEKTANRPLTFQTMQLNAKALEVVSKGNTDIETLHIVMKHLNAAIKEVDCVMSARNKIITANSECPEQGNESVTTDHDLGIQTNVDVVGNRYGASGSSAVMSDSEGLNIKAPIANRNHGRARVNRYRSKADTAVKKLTAKRSGNAMNETNSNNKRILSTSTTDKAKLKRQRKVKEKVASDKNLGLPYQSRFLQQMQATGAHEDDL